MLCYNAAEFYIYMTKESIPKISIKKQKNFFLLYKLYYINNLSAVFAILSLSKENTKVETTHNFIKNERPKLSSCF